ncbi:hypothetical protein IWQ57_004675, partial [Coemansia nantahalensis]
IHQGHHAGQAPVDGLHQGLRGRHADAVLHGAQGRVRQGQGDSCAPTRGSAREDPGQDAVADCPPGAAVLQGEPRAHRDRPVHHPRHCRVRVDARDGRAEPQARTQQAQHLADRRGWRDDGPRLGVAVPQASRRPGGAQLLHRHQGAHGSDDTRGKCRRQQVHHPGGVYPRHA